MGLEEFHGLRIGVLSIVLIVVYDDARSSTPQGTNGHPFYG